MGHNSAFTAPFRQFGKANEIEDQRSRKNGIISLPGKLKRHLGAEKPSEVNEIPGCFLVVKGGDITYADRGMGRVSKDFGQNLVFRPDFGFTVSGVIEYLPIHVSKYVKTFPAHYFKISPGKHRSQSRFNQSFARFPVVSHDWSAFLSRKLHECRGKSAI